MNSSKDLSYTLLLVDDEAGIRNVLEISLTDMGYEVHSAANGEAALQMFKELHPQIVLTDIKMPGMDGIALLEHIKKIDSETEVIMITGHGDIDLAIQSLKLEATDFITKPINDAVLEIALKRARDRIVMRDKLRQYTENLEQLVEEKSRKLIEAERLSAIGETIAGLSHAIKNIAGGLTGGAFVLEKGLSQDDKTYLLQGWEMVKRNVEKIKDLSMNLLDYAKPATIKYRLGNPALPAREVVELMQAQADRSGVQLILDIQTDDSEIYLDPESLHRCLLNLVTNAIDACQSEDCTQKKKMVSLLVRPYKQSGVEYRVIDNCLGMDSAVRENIFQHFFSTKGSAGTGIGLMLTKKIVDSLKGHIEVETEYGVGSTFIIRIPMGRKGWRRKY
jgi:signal transduction histidine kinase